VEEKMSDLSNSELDQLMQLFYRTPVWDGYLISKSARSKFMEMGYVWKDDNGNNFLTDEGMDYAGPIADTIDWPSCIK
jgi:hypothetical protein